MLRSLWQYIKKKKLTYSVVVVALLIDFSLSVLPTRIIQYVIDEIVAKRLTEQVMQTQLILLGVITLAIYVSGYIWGTNLYYEAVTYAHELRVSIFSKLVNMRTPYYQKFTSGDMMTRFTNDITNMSDLMGYGSMSIFIALAALLFIIPTMLLINWQITVLALIPLIVLGIAFHFMGMKQETLVDESRDAVAALSHEVLEVVEGIRVTRAYAKQAIGRQQFQEKTATLRQKSNRIIRLQGLYGRLANSVMTISTIVVVILGAYYLEQGQITLGEVVALQLFVMMLLEPVWILSDIILVYQMAKISFVKIDELLQTDDDMEADGQEILQTANQIVFDQYDFRYATAHQLSLSQINLTIQKGETLGIVGKTGSGKTTLIRQLLRQYPVGQGQLLINGQAIQHYKRSSMEALIGYVPQEHTLFSRSVYENLRIGKMDADMIEVAAAVEAASFTEDLERMSDGIETLIGEKGVSISGGQKQRISIARAFIKTPEILILDDSLSAVDAKTERRIIENIQTLRQGKTTIIVTHRLSAVSHADWVIVLDEGKIVEAGTPEQLIQQKGWYFEQYERQQLEGEN